jgi:5'(3')-deoxyribonucleotidase
MANKPVIAVDLDDVLAEHAQEFVNYSNKKWGTNLKVGDYQDHWAEIWNVDEAETQRRLRGYLDAGQFAKYKTVTNADKILTELKNRYKLVILTARQKSLQKDTLYWVKKHFTGIFDDVHFAGVWDLPMEQAVKMDKTAVAKQIGADYLIEDQPRYALPAARGGIKVLLFGDYPWNQMEKLPKGMVRVKDWQEVLEYFDGRS